MTGIDITIQNLIDLFNNKLWTSNVNNFHGRIYDNEKRENGNVIGIDPELFISGEDYKEKLLNDKVDSTVFFRVTNLDPTELLADVSIYFSVNLTKLYPNITTERADEYAIQDAKKWINWSEFRIVSGGIIKGKLAFDDYFGADQNKHDMQPYFLFRIDTEVSYSIDACPATEPTTYNLTLSSDTNGSITTNKGDEDDSPITVNSGDNVAAYAIANANFAFNQWLDNTNIVTQNPYPFVMKNNKDLVAQFISLAVLAQQFFTGSNDISGLELVDHSLNVNAKIQGSYFDGLGVNYFIVLNDSIAIDWTTDGMKFEAVASNGSTGTRSSLISISGDVVGGIRISTTGISLHSIGAILNFSSLVVPANDEFVRFKIVVTTGNITVFLTTPDDVDYLSAISQTLSKGAFDDIMTINGIGGNIPKLNGGLAYMNIDGTIFNFEENELTSRLFASNNDNFTNSLIEPERLNNYTDKICASKEGYARIYYQVSSNELFIMNLPYNEGASNVGVMDDPTFKNYAFEEFPEGQFGRGYGFKLDASIEVYDFNNTFFDGSSIAKIITSKEMPTKLDNRIYYDTVNNSDVLIYDVEKILNSVINLVGEECIIVGDSQASKIWDEIITDKLGMNLTVKAYSGQSTANVLLNIQSDVVSDPTLLSKQKVIFHISGFNDYAQDVTPSKLTADFNDTNIYYRSENVTAKIIWIQLYNWGNPIDDGTTPNAGGLTMDGIRSIVLAESQVNSDYSSNWANANIIQSDIPDDLHTDTATGGLKLANKVIETINTIEE